MRCALRARCYFVSAVPPNGRHHNSHTKRPLYILVDLMPDNATKVSKSSGIYRRICFSLALVKEYCTRTVFACEPTVPCPSLPIPSLREGPSSSIRFEVALTLFIESVSGLSLSRRTEGRRGQIFMVAMESGRTVQH